MRQILFTTLIAILIVPLEVYAQQQGRITFHDLPGLNGAANLNIEQYINALYVLAISLAAILAVLKLIWAGVQYMLTDIVTSKQKAKDDIRGALLGLVIILAAVTILNTINPNLTNLNILGNARNTTVIPGSGGGGGTTITPIDPNTDCPVDQPPSCSDPNREICPCLPPPSA